MQGICISHTITSSQKPRTGGVGRDLEDVDDERKSLEARKFCCGTKFDGFPLVRLLAMPNSI